MSGFGSVSLKPPATSTRPSDRSVAVCSSLPWDVTLAGDHPVAGSNSSEDASPTLCPPWPPTTSTCPLSSSVAVWPSRTRIKS